MDKKGGIDRQQGPIIDAIRRSAIYEGGDGDELTPFLLVLLCDTLLPNNF